jgi:hypothetical protein
MNINQIIHDFRELGIEFLRASADKGVEQNYEKLTDSILSDEIREAHHYNPWFIPQFTQFAFAAWAQVLEEVKIKDWLSKYSGLGETVKNSASVGLVMAGNIPAVGLHDLLCVLASGHHALVRLSTSDNKLIPAILDVLTRIDPELKNRFTLVEGPLKKFDAVIATGSNNSSRYFDYYFGKYPHIIRKNRNSVAVLTGNETGEEMKELASDIFMYFGLGCRNVSKLYMPDGMRIEDVMPYFEDYGFLADHNKYRNNYDYQKSLLLINRVDHRDNGFLLAREEPSLMSPISVLHTGTYSSAQMLNEELDRLRDGIQCIVSSSGEIKDSVRPGRSQMPELWDYADGIDTMKFLLNLRNSFKN